jgi:type I restriction enzyme S subunit
MPAKRKAATLKDSTGTLGLEADGTAFGSINNGSFEKVSFITPPGEIVSAYERPGPLEDQNRTHENQTRTVVTLRDTLLPNLLKEQVLNT